MTDAHLRRPVVTPAAGRYETMSYRRCGRSGLLLPSVSLGLWWNFGAVDPHEVSRAMILRAFDLGITHFDLANNYGPPPGSAEETFGRVLREDLRAYRDEMIISSKAGWRMWPGPYGDWGSRKYLIASLDQSLKRMGIDYVDIFYHHRPDPDTPLEESMAALDQIARSGKAIYVGVSSYGPEDTRRAAKLLGELGTPFVIHQPRYNMFDRWIEHGLLDALDDIGIGCVVFSPLAQGLLTDRYLAGIAADSRAAKPHILFGADRVTQDKLDKARRLSEVARARGQNLAQMAMVWTLRHPQVTSAVIGASRVSQIDEAVGALNNMAFADDELRVIDTILAS